MVMYSAIFFMNLFLIKIPKFQNAPINLTCHETYSLQMDTHFFLHEDDESC